MNLTHIEFCKHYFVNVSISWKIILVKEESTVGRLRIVNRPFKPLRPYVGCDSTPVLFTGVLLGRDIFQIQYIIMLFSILLKRTVVYPAFCELSIS